MSTTGMTPNKMKVEDCPVIALKLGLMPHCWLRKSILGACILASLVVSRIVTAQAEHTNPQELVEKFCATEFRGTQDVEQRQNLVHFSDAHLHELGEIMGGLSPYVFEWEVAPLEVVNSYKVDRITVAGAEATAVVTYQVVAQRGSWGGRIAPVPRKDVTTQLQLRRYGDTWKVIDPPFPRVSNAFLSSSYRGLFVLPGSWYQNASPEQLMRLRNAIDSILLLHDLK